MVLAARPTTYSYLMIECTLQPSYQIAICAPDSSGAAYHEGKSLYEYEADVAEMQHHGKKNCYHLLQWSGP